MKPHISLPNSYQPRRESQSWVFYPYATYHHFDVDGDSISASLWEKRYQAPWQGCPGSLHFAAPKLFWGLPEGKTGIELTDQSPP
jgi:hypothetical protein